MKSKWVMALAVGVLASAVYAGNVLATPSSGLTTTILARSVFHQFELKGHSVPPGTWEARMKTRGLTDTYVVDNKLEPGGTTGWHSHPGPSLILVVAGAVTNYDSGEPGCAPHTYTAGTGFIDAGGQDVHTLRNNGSVQAETIAVQFLPKDAVRKVDKPQPANCR